MRTEVATPERHRESRSSSSASRAEVVLLGFDGPVLEDLCSEFEDEASLSTPVSWSEALELLQARDVAVLCLGPGVSGVRAKEFIHEAEVFGRNPGQLCDRRNIVLAGGPDLEIYQDLVDDGTLFYLSRHVPAARDVSRILRSAWQDARRTSTTRSDTRLVREVCERAHFLADETDPRRLSLEVAQAIKDTIGADRSQCMNYDAHHEILSVWTMNDPSLQVESAAAGLVSFVVRTGSTVRVDTLGDDPRYEPEADNQGGDPEERLLAVPVALPHLTAEGATRSLEANPRVLAVLVAIRSAAADPFTDLDVELLELLGDRLAPVMDRLASHSDDVDRGEADGGDSRESLFRAEALRHYTRGDGELGRPLEISPRWTRWVFPLMVLALVAGLLYSLVGTVNEYARGIAVVRADGESDQNFSVISLFPGRARPQLEPGMPLDFKVDGYPASNQRLTIESVSEIVGPGEAARVLGARIADAVPLAGPLTIVRSSLSSDHFVSGTETYPYHDGLQGTAEVELRAERILFSLLPDLRSSFEGLRD